MRVSLVIVSHSDALARGVAEVAAQMAPDVRVTVAGGLPGGGVGTDFETTAAALSDAGGDSGSVVLYDLGSARMTAEMAVEALDDPASAIVVDAPLVEGAVAAAVASQSGNDASAVARAARDACAPTGGEPAEVPGDDSRVARASEELVLTNEVGLHARPAALMARTLTGLDAGVTVSFGEGEADAHSVLAIMGLGARKGDRIGLSAQGPDADRALGLLRDLAARDFDE